MLRTVCTASLCLATALSLRAQQPTFRTAVDLVHFGVAVVDKQGKPVTGLTAEDFQVLENGKPQTLKYFSAGAPEEAPPLHLGLLLDTSGSMAGDIKDARSAAVKFVNALDHAADVTLVDFDTEVRVARFGPNDYPRLVERIRGRKPDGWTALYDAIGVYLNGAQAQEGQKVLVHYTDGGDTRSSLSFYDMLNLCKASDVTVYAVGYMEHQGSSRMQQRNELERVATTTGGVSLRDFRDRKKRNGTLALPLGFRVESGSERRPETLNVAVRHGSCYRHTEARGVRRNCRGANGLDDDALAQQALRGTNAASRVAQDEGQDWAIVARGQRYAALEQKSPQVFGILSHARSSVACNAGCVQLAKQEFSEHWGRRR